MKHQSLVLDNCRLTSRNVVLYTIFYATNISIWADEFYFAFPILCPKTKVVSDEHIFYIATISQIRDPFQCFCLPTHDYSFQLKSTPFYLLPFVYVSTKAQKIWSWQWSWMYMQQISFKISFDNFLLLLFNVYKSLFEFKAA